MAVFACYAWPGMPPAVSTTRHDVFARRQMIRVSISLEDYLGALRLHRRRLVNRLLLVLPVVAAAGMLAISIGHRWPGLLLIAASIGALIGELVQSRLILPRWARKIHRQQASLRTVYTYSWDRLGIDSFSEAGQHRRAWSDYVKALENDRFFLLYHSDAMFEVFPKSCFSSPEQADEFRALAFRENS
ncbi:YcxB family protein [Luteimonas sp. e5]